MGRDWLGGNHKGFPLNLIVKTRKLIILQQINKNILW